MSNDNQLLIVAWDGLDYELIQKFGLENIPLDNMGKIDNDTGIHTRSTSELYTSFITGDNYYTHGVTGINKFNKRGEILENIFPAHIRGGLPATRLIYNKLWDLIGADKRKYDKTDYDTSTLFDEIENSNALFIPGYNPGFGWAANLKSHTLDELMYKQSPEYTETPMIEGEKTVKMMFERRWNIFKDAFDDGEYELLMVHFHYPDYLQHFYGTKGLNYDEERLKKMYEYIDKKAGKIRKWADLYNYDVMFMSDHGLPENMEHNKQAFFSTQGFEVQESWENSSEGYHITGFKEEIKRHLQEG